MRGTQGPCRIEFRPAVSCAGHPPPEFTALLDAGSLPVHTSSTSPHMNAVFPSFRPWPPSFLTPICSSVPPPSPPLPSLPLPSSHGHPGPEGFVEHPRVEEGVGEDEGQHPPRAVQGVQLAQKPTQRGAVQMDLSHCRRKRMKRQCVRVEQGKMERKGRKSQVDENVGSVPDHMCLHLQYSLPLGAQTTKDTAAHGTQYPPQ